MRRLLFGLVLAVALAAPANRAAADDQVPIGEEWGGSSVRGPAPITGPTSEIRVEGHIQNGEGRRESVAYTRPDVAVTFDPAFEAGCRLRPEGTATAADMSSPSFGGGISDGWKAYSYSADVPFAPDRNGAYKVFVCIDGLQRIDTDVLVQLPAPTVTNLVATPAGHDVTLSWDDMRIGAPDVSGYRVERSIDGGAFTALDAVGPEAPTFTDDTLPEAGGEATYQVIALRPHVGDAAPSATSTATFTAAPPTTGGGGGSGTGGGTGATGPGAVAAGGTGGSGGGGDRPTITPGPTIHIPRVGNPSRNFFPALLAPPAIDGFSEELPYDQAQGDPIGDELASEPLEALPGRGLAIPIATGLVLGVWALHLRFLARASRPEYADPIEVFLDR